jgi:hypothetical protein
MLFEQMSPATYTNGQGQAHGEGSGRLCTAAGLVFLSLFGSVGYETIYLLEPVPCPCPSRS